MSAPGGNSGHGHVYPRPDGVKARCGGPALCKTCQADAARKSGDDAARQAGLTQALVLRPGDHVLIGIASEPPEEHVIDMKAQLHERFPDVEFTIITGTAGMAVAAEQMPTGDDFVSGFASPALINRGGGDVSDWLRAHRERWASPQFWAREAAVTGIGSFLGILILVAATLLGLDDFAGASAAAVIALTLYTVVSLIGFAITSRRKANR